MSTNRPSRHHGFRGYAADHDRLKRALLLPVQSWVKKWQYPNGGKNFEILKWTKSDKKLTFDDADESGIVVTTRQQVNSE
ncbi:10498_t:CDS:2, partial [Dentiscutata heterogama]